MTTQQEVFQAWVNARIAEEQAALQAEAEQRRRSSNQSVINWQIAYDKHRAEENALIQKVKADQAKRDEQRERERERDAEELAEQQKTMWKGEALQRWSASGLPLDDFDRAWPDILRQAQLDAFHTDSPAISRVRQNVRDQMG